MKRLPFYFCLLFGLSGPHLFAQAPVCFQFALSSAEANTSDTVRLRVSSRGFEDLASFQFVLSWDTAHLQFHKMAKQAPTFNNILYNVNLVKEGHLLTLWDDLSTLGVTIPNDSSLMELWFIVRTDSTGFIPVLMESDRFLTLIYEAWHRDEYGMPYVYKVGGVYANGAPAPPDVPSDVCMTTLFCNAPATAQVYAPHPAQFEWNGMNGWLGTGDSLVGIREELIHLQVFDTVTGGRSEYYLRAQKEQVGIPVGVDSLRHPYCKRANGYIALDLEPQFAPYSINWSDIGNGPSVRSDLTAGAYQVTVTSANGCAGFSNFDLTDQGMTVSLDSINADCRSKLLGSVSANVDNGVMPYQYKWSVPGQTGMEIDNLLPGRYTLTVTDATGCSLINQTSVLDYGTFDWLVSGYGYCGTGLGDHQLVIKNSYLKNRVEYPLKLTLDNGIQEYFENTVPETMGFYTNLPMGVYQFTVTDAQGCSVSREVSLACEDILLPTVMNNYLIPRIFVNEIPFTNSWHSDSSCASIKIDTDIDFIDKMDFTLEWNENTMELAHLDVDNIYKNQGLVVQHDSVLHRLNFSMDNPEDFFVNWTNLAKVCFKKKGNASSTDLYFVEGAKVPNITLYSGQNIGFAGRSGRIRFSNTSNNSNLNFGMTPPSCRTNGNGQIFLWEQTLANNWANITEIHRNGIKLSLDKSNLLQAIPGTYQINVQDQQTPREVFIQMPFYGSFSCVWPGDLDRNGVVNLYDWVNLTYKQSADPRPFATNLWYGQDGIYSRDANGDGLCNADDSLAIHQNWERVTTPSTLGPGKLPKGVNCCKRLKYVTEPVPLMYDSTVYLPLYACSQDLLPIENEFSGAAFSVNYDTQIFGQGVSFTPTLPGDDPIGSIRHHFRLIPEHHKLDVGLWVDGVKPAYKNGDTLRLGYLVLHPSEVNTDDSQKVHILLTRGLFYVRTYPYAIDDSVIELDIETLLQVNTGESNLEHQPETLMAYPNPAGSYIDALCSHYPCWITLYDANGRVIQEVKSSLSGKHRFDLADLPTGIHYLRAVTESGAISKSFFKK